MTEQFSIDITPKEELESLLDEQNQEALSIFLHLLAPEDTLYTIAHLSEEHQVKLFTLLSEQNPDFAADLIDHLPDIHAADILEDMDSGTAAAIVDHMDSDQQADVLLEIKDKKAESILNRMAPEEAQDARDRLQYDNDTAGGLMITEILKFPQDQKVDQIVDNLQGNEQAYDTHETKYVYLTDEKDILLGVVSTRRIPLAPHGCPASKIMVSDPLAVDVESNLDELQRIFDSVDFSALPVVDMNGKLCGVVQRSAIHEALTQQSSRTLLKFSGIIGGEELRSMPFHPRWTRRLAFLLPGIFLSLLSVSIIDFYQPLIHKLTVLAVFLPLVANLSGAAGNQAIAVSIRELALGLVKPGDMVRVLKKEVFLGLINGIIIGAILTLIFMITQERHYGLAVTIGIAYAANSVFAVCIGGTIPLLLKAAKVDPAMMSGPILTTLTDMGSFFLTLTLTTLMLLAIGS